MAADEPPGRGDDQLLNNNSRARTAGCSDRFASIRRIRDTIWILGVPLSKSTDGGKTFTASRGMHSDHHGLWIDPANTNIIYNANDGGFYQTADGGKTWRFAVQRRRRAVLQRRARHELAVLGVRIDSGSRQPPRAIDLSEGRDAISPVASRERPAARARITRSIRPTRTSSTRTASTAIFSRTDLTRAAGRRAGRSRRPRPGRGGARRRSSRPIRTPSCARSGWRRSSSPRTTTASSMRAISSCSGPRTAATSGKRSAPI